MVNLLEETKAILKEHGLSLKDVSFVMNEDYEIPVDTFIRESNHTYDNGYGLEEVCLTLQVVGENWWLERHEYDGSEWWEFKKKPHRPTRIISNVSMSNRLIFYVKREE